MKRLALMLAVIAIPQAGIAADATEAPAAPVPNATLQCTTGGGGLSNCKVTEEMPEGSGLGMAALIGSACASVPKPNPAPSGAKMSGNDSSLIQVVVQFAGVSLPVAPSWSGCGATALQASSPLEKPKFSKRPTGDDFVRLYPAGAENQGASGRVSVQCTIKGDLLDSCSILQETPKNMGFGQATLQIMKIFRLEPQDADGHAVEGGQFRTIVLWRIG